MTQERIRQILERVAAGRITPARAIGALRDLPFEDLGFAKVDRHRTLRRGIPEVIFGEGKSAAQIIAIGRRVMAGGSNLVVTRLAPAKAREIKRSLARLRYHPDAQLGAIVTNKPPSTGHGVVMVITAG
ncbi:MAG: nickel pincer cofactor biosynthesis protein LarB, partial [Candidatus Binataceae bacterium]